MDIVVGPQTYHRLPELVAKVDPGTRSRIVDTEFPEEVKFDYLPGEHSPRARRRFSVQEGCDKFCSLRCPLHKEHNSQGSFQCHC